jgi:hypothetical protein
MKQDIYQALASVADTFYIAIDDDHTSFPVIRYYFVSVTPSLTGDDTTFHKSHRLNIDLFLSDYDELIQEQLEQAITSLPYPIRFLTKEERKENEIFWIRYEFNFEF